MPAQLLRKRQSDFNQDNTVEDTIEDTVEDEVESNVTNAATEEVADNTENNEEYDDENEDEDEEYDEDEDEEEDENDDENDDEDDENSDENNDENNEDSTTTTTEYYPTTDENYVTTTIESSASLPTVTTYYDPTPTADEIPSTSAWTPTETSFVSNTVQPITETPSPTLESNSGEGLSNKNKAIVGGVVGGVGGAILLGVLGFLFFVRWKKNRRASDRESFHPQADDAPEMSAGHNSGEYSYYNSATNHSVDRIIPSQPGRY